MSGILRSSRGSRLRALTPARVDLGRTGVSQRTADLLDFQRAHAQARDAVHARLDAETLAAAMKTIVDGDVLCLRSAATNRAKYLQCPDLGRRLAKESREFLEHVPNEYCDLSIVIADGLSALAVERHAAALLKELLPRLEGWRLTPLCVVEQGRVAIGDEIGAALGAQLCVVLIGERPGLSSPDSLGAYLTWEPHPGRTDAERNCISNIRGEGLSYSEAARQLALSLAEARRRRLTGTGLKLESHSLESD
ncbi:MAG TPA: ethanolamine ammonia-lyase subunit EutC [Terracidiphilus sp.]|nr:ethanolamine ammonia-lyase subunit EutC [Terracidiphilus sp.]